MREDVHVETVAPQRWRLVGVTTDITERKQMEEALRESEERTRLIVETALDAVVTMDASGTITGWNAQAEAVFGWPRSEVIGRSLSETIVPPAYREAHEKGLRYFLATGEGSLLNRRVEITALHRSGREFPVELAISPARVGDTYTFSAFVRDITERKRLEDQLLQAQKMESVGRLAGGIAHDFNNLLTAILGYAELAEDETDPQEVRQYLSHVRQAAEKASDLTRQLLTFARRQIIAPRTVNINDLILSLDKLLRRLIGENIELVMLPKEGLHSVKVDPGQFEQILVNLVVNSRDAMPDGGKITIETANVTLDAEYARQHEEVVPGEYVLLAVSDTGSGMEEAIRLHIFEPFFTTKEKGRGTGLGLATVYGIVKQSGGHIWLYSEPGEGTAFKIYLPRTTETPEAVSNAPRKTVQPGGSETILLVEDEPAVRALAAQTLQARGYAVIEAMNGEEALRLVKGREAQIRLLITDVVMPQMNGKELAERLQALHPGMKVLYSSGYTENTIVHHGVLKPGIAFLSKPFTPTMLAGKVREVLDSGASR
jgi:PAS domain S-box-containing protein